MNILITGCNGQLGNEMQLLAKRHKLNYDKYKITKQPTLSWQDKATLQQE